MNKLVARTIFLGLTAIVLGLEILFSADGNPDTEPWTILIVENINGELVFAAIGALTVWLFVHFGIRIKERMEHDES